MKTVSVRLDCVALLRCVKVCVRLESECLWELVFSPQFTALFWRPRNFLDVGPGWVLKEWAFKDYTPLLSRHGATSDLHSQCCLPSHCKLYPLKLQAKINLCSLDCFCRVLWSRRQEQSMPVPDRTSRTAACSLLMELLGSLGFF